MVKVRFKADAKLPANKGGKRWLHKKGGRKYGAAGTFRLVEPTYFESGKAYEVKDEEAAWLVAHYPQCFAEVESKPKKADKPEESE